MPDLVSSGDEDEASVRNNEDNEIVGGWQAEEAAMADELTHRMAAVSVATTGDRTSASKILAVVHSTQPGVHMSHAVLHPPAPPLTLRMSLALLADDDARGSTTPSSSCHEGDELAKDVVAKLKRHPLCQNAWFDWSRGSFKILRTDQKYFEFGIPDVQKLHSSIPVIQTYAKALEFLNAETNQETNAKACEAPRDEETKQD